MFGFNLLQVFNFKLHTVVELWLIYLICVLQTNECSLPWQHIFFVQLYLKWKTFSEHFNKGRHNNKFSWSRLKIMRNTFFFLSMKVANLTSLHINIWFNSNARLIRLHDQHIVRPALHPYVDWVLKWTFIRKKIEINEEKFLYTEIVVPAVQVLKAFSREHVLLIKVYNKVYIKEKQKCSRMDFHCSQIWSSGHIIVHYLSYKRDTAKPFSTHQLSFDPVLFLGTVLPAL